MPNLDDIFVEFQQYLDKEQHIVDGIKAAVNDIDSSARRVIFTLQVIHHDLSAEANACYTARQLFETVREKYAILAKSMPLTHYHRYHDIWKHVTQKLCFCAALTVWLEKGFLLTRETAAGILGIGAKEGSGEFYLDIEDFLMGVLELVSELSRLAINSVTLGEYNRPVQIARFVNEVNAGFKLLSFKNDALRRRFDALKYDVKKIEEVVYDLRLRNLIHQTQS